MTITRPLRLVDNPESVLPDTLVSGVKRGNWKLVLLSEPWRRKLLACHFPTFWRSVGSSRRLSRLHTVFDVGYNVAESISPAFFEWICKNRKDLVIYKMHQNIICFRICVMLAMLHWSKVSCGEKPLLSHNMQTEEEKNSSMTNLRQHVSTILYICICNMCMKPSKYADGWHGL